MKYSNSNRWDRFLRVALGALMLVIGWRAENDVQSLALRVFALYPLITGLVGWCPTYALLRISTRRADRKKRSPAGFGHHPGERSGKEDGPSQGKEV